MRSQTFRSLMRKKSFAAKLVRNSVGGQGCSFPSGLDGVYDSTHERDPLTFNSSYVSPFWVDTQSHLFENLTFECNFINGSYYIARSATSITIYTVPYYIYTCWMFTKMSDNKFVQYQGTTKLASAANLNYKIYPIAYAVSSDLICDVSAFTGDTVSMLVKQGTGESEKTSCPVSLWGKYVYSLTDSSGSTFCSFNSWLDICTDTSAPTVNTTLCTDTTLYSAAGNLYCLFSMTDSATSDTYVYLYNGDTTVDSSTTYRFTCVLMKYSSSVTYMTQYPNECLDSSSQNSTYIATSPGGVYTMYANVTCRKYSCSMATSTFLFHTEQGNPGLLD
ncbi:uncharacterized protein LOC143284349 [Babylonia areolata]|uniref:uncharacterized protein LOC143284349 n=1 Tax=Babylonia areolata TaxID=304850 RepID=UPI003FD3C02A